VFEGHFQVRSVPVGAVALSPVTDLALSGGGFDTRADADRWARSRVLRWGPSEKSDGVTDLTGLPAIRVNVGMMKRCSMIRAAMYRAASRSASVAH